MLFLVDAKKVIMKTVGENIEKLPDKPESIETLKEMVNEELKKLIHKELKREPLVQVVILTSL